MTFYEFSNIYRKKDIIDSRDFPLLGDENYLRRQVSEWVKKNKLISLRRGLYVINDLRILQNLPPSFVANMIYRPSYLSLEWAMRYYQFIPEEVYSFTSVSTRKTKNFENQFGMFYNRQIKRELFWGFQNIEMSRKKILIATPEKTIIDFLYFNRHKFFHDPEMLKTYRFQNLDILNKNRIHEYSKKLDEKLLQLFNKFLEILS
jgi:predicted transcriptional regulator of viral defense system